MIQHQQHLPEAWQTVRRGIFSEGGWAMLLLVVTGMLLNWFLEIRKWQLLVVSVEPVSFRKAFVTVLASLAVGLTTPNRVGEFGMRAMYLQPPNRKAGFFYTLFSSTAQFLTTFIFGMLAACMWFSDKPSFLLRYPFSKFGFFLFVLSISICIFFLLLFYGGTTYLHKKISRIFLLRRFFPPADQNLFITNPLRWNILFLSILRYLIFSLQLVLLWELTGAGLTVYHAVTGAGVVFFIMAFVPTIALADLGIRGQVSVWVLGVYSHNFLAIVTGMAALWFINLFIPAALGSVLIWSIRNKTVT